MNQTSRAEHTQETTPESESERDSFHVIKSNKNGFVQPFLQAMSQRASHTPIELPLNQPKPSRKTRKKSQKNSLEEKKLKKPWEEQFSEGSPPPETVSEREEQNTG